MAYDRRVTLQDTDATGVIHFTSLFNFCIEAFEKFLFDKGFSVKKMIDHSTFVLPVVHAQADYMAPIGVDDHLTVDFSLTFNEKSLHVDYEVKKEGETVGTAKTVHAVVDKKSRKGIPVSLDLLEKIGDDNGC